MITQEDIKRAKLKVLLKQKQDEEQLPKSVEQQKTLMSGGKLPWYEINRTPTTQDWAQTQLRSPKREIESFTSGVTGGLTDYLQAALIQRKSQIPIDTSIGATIQALRTGQNVPSKMQPMNYNQALQQVRSEQYLPFKIAGSLAPTGLTSGIGKGFGSIANKLFNVGGKGLSTFQNLVRSIPSGIASGAATGATLTALENLNAPTKADYAVPVLIGATLGGVGNLGATYGKILEQNAKKTAFELNEDLKNIADAETKSKIIQTFRKQWEKAGRNELSEQQAFNIVKDSYNQFKNSSFNVFKNTLDKFLTEKRSIPKQTQQAILSVLNKNGLIEKNPETGKFIFSNIGKGFYPQPVQSNIAQQGIVVGKTLPKEQEELFKAYKSISTPYNQSTKAMQNLKVGYSSQADFDKEGANRISKMIQGNLKNDILSGVESQFGKSAKNIISKAYQNAESDIKTQQIIENALGKNFKLDQQNIEGFYKKFSQNFIDNTDFRRSLLKMVSKKDAAALTDDMIQKTMRETLRNGNFVPHRFMSSMNKMKIGTPKGKLEKLVQDGLLSQDDMRQLKRLYNFAVQLDKKGMSEIPLTGPIMDGLSVNVGTTLQRFLGPNARQIFTGTGLLKKGAEKLQKDLITKENLQRLGRGLQKTGGALKSGQSSAVINQLINSGE